MSAATYMPTYGHITKLYGTYIFIAYICEYMCYTYLIYEIERFHVS